MQDNSHVTGEEQRPHIPVMLNEVIGFLSLKAGQTIVDATVGLGGHARRIVDDILPGGQLICIDRDEESLRHAEETLEDFREHCAFLHGNFSDIDALLGSIKVSGVDGIVLDLGISSYQLDTAERGFSFQNEGPLDMRLDRKSYISAYDLVNNLNEEELSGILWTYGQERWHNRIARFIVYERQKHPIATTRQLSDIVCRAIPYRSRERIHPATRTFQAIRIAVNRELESLESGLEKCLKLLRPGARICVISFHSLEDRLVKHAFRRHASQDDVAIVTKKPLVPTDAERSTNPSSRSAKLRVAEKR